MPKTKFYAFSVAFLCGLLPLTSTLPYVQDIGIKTAHAARRPQISGSPVDLQADKLVHDQSGQSVTATGNVILKQDGKTVRADEIVYQLHEDTVVATGNVEFIDISGDHHYAQRFEFNDSLKEGFVEGLKSVLVDGSRFTASRGRHVAGEVTHMKDAHYTPCEVCEVNPKEDPLWQIRASEVEHDIKDQTISYRNARFEIKGVPVAYLPYFSHPDGEVKQKSGVLTPTAGYSSDLGAFVEGRYYWALAPEKDLTLGLVAMTEESPLAKAQWRQRWDKASLNMLGSITYSQRTDEEAGRQVARNDKLRGHVKAEALWDINTHWRSGANLYLVSDEQYLRQYDFDDEDVLENEVYVERFSGRNYLSGRLLAFKDTRVAEERNEVQPNILPEIETQLLGEPGSVPVIGGRWSVGASMLGLIRDDDGQDVNRVHAQLGWERRLMSQTGLITTIDASVQGSLYNVNDRTGYQTNSAIEGNSTEKRAFGYIHAQTRYPLVKTYDNAQAVIEPVISLTLAPEIDDDDIPNEDSQDVQIDALGLFEPNRFPGIDGAEDQSRVTYGLRTGAYSDDGSHAEIFLGQSYRFENDDTIFSAGSGLDEQSSDIVGEVGAGYKGDYTLDYRFQIDNESLSSQRHEIDVNAHMANLRLSSRYLFAKAIADLDDGETREQIYNQASYDIDENWSVYGAARHDLGDDPGLRTADIGVIYSGQCVSWSLAGKRTLTKDISGDSGTELFLRVGFKNLGELQTSALQLGGGE
ncbi:MAG: LPS-assembly protein LptD [Alphaproteobacteria bacterium]